MNIDKKTIRNIFLGVLTCIVVYWVLHEPEKLGATLNVVKDVLFPFALGGSIAFIINVPMRAIENRLIKIKNEKFRRILALVLTFVCVLLVLTLISVLLVPQLISSAKSFIPKLENLPSAINNLINRYPRLLGWLKDIVDKLNVAEFIEELITSFSSRLSSIVSGTFTVISTITDSVVDVVIAIVFSVYCLCQKETLSRQGRKLLYAFAPEKISDNVVRILRLTNATFSNFLSGQCVEVCILGCMFAIAMAIFKMPYIPLISVLVAVTAFIPVVGAWAGCVIGTLLILIENPIQALWFVVLFIFIQQIENNIIYPRVVGTSIGLSGMWVLVAVGVGGELMGAAGMFLMIPVVSVMYTLVQEVVQKRLAKRPVDPEKLKAQPPELSRRRLKWNITFKKKVKDENTQSKK